MEHDRRPSDGRYQETRGTMKEGEQDRRYRVHYRIGHDEGEGLTEAELQGRREGGCDALLLAHVLRNGGRLQFQFLSLDGKTGKTLSDRELFVIWSSLAHVIKDGQLEPTQRQLARMVFETAVAEAAGAAPSHTWLAPGGGRCDSCDHPVVVIHQEGGPETSLWYCANPKCARHQPVEVGASEWPDWVARPGRTKQIYPVVAHADNGNSN